MRNQNYMPNPPDNHQPVIMTIGIILSLAKIIGMLNHAAIQRVDSQREHGLDPRNAALLDLKRANIQRNTIDMQFLLIIMVSIGFIYLHFMQNNARGQMVNVPAPEDNEGPLDEPMQPNFKRMQSIWVAAWGMIGFSTGFFYDNYLQSKNEEACQKTSCSEDELRKLNGSTEAKVLFISPAAYMIGLAGAVKFSEWDDHPERAPEIVNTLARNLGIMKPRPHQN